MADRSTHPAGATTRDAGVSGAGRLELNVTSDPNTLAAVRQACERFCQGAGMGAADAGDVGLCVNEAMANVMRHAYGGATDRPIRVTAEPVDGGVRVTLRDWGTGVNPAAVPPKPPDPLKPGGLGLVCIRKLMDEVVFTPQPDGMMLTMTKRISRTGAER
jgi:anti-sigma regulatory factor (Ser/Thr protein kinase)